VSMGNRKYPAMSIQRHIRGQYWRFMHVALLYLHESPSFSVYLLVGDALFIAERKTSLGKDWHRGCLRCAKCSKTLTPGSHAEVYLP
jgi:hypothetical protein